MKLISARPSSYRGSASFRCTATVRRVAMPPDLRYRLSPDSCAAQWRSLYATASACFLTRSRAARWPNHIHTLGYLAFPSRIENSDGAHPGRADRTKDARIARRRNAQDRLGGHAIKTASGARGVLEGTRLRQTVP
jgi:hypothetical protein